MKYTFSLFLILSLSFAACAQGKQITLDDIYRNGIFSSRSIHGLRSMNDGEHYTTLEKGQYIVKYAYKTGNATDTLFALARENSPISQIQGYAFSDNEQRILLYTNSQPVYRHSYRADYFVWDMNQKNLVPVSENGPQQLATFSPDGSKVAFVRNNNLYLTDLVNAEVAITSDGRHNEIINGAPDWVYEEEFSFSKAFTWSPDNLRIAWIRFDEREVPLFAMAEYGNLLYPRWDEFKYPKAGEKNSVVSVHIYDLQNRATNKVDIGNNKEQYIPRIKWTSNPEQLAVIRLNRLQNHVDLLIADAANGKTNTLYSESNKYYFDDVNDNWVNFTPDGKYFFIFSERNGYNHLYLHDMKTGKQLHPLTSGNYDISSLLGYHPGTKRIYYIAANESPLHRNVFSVDINGRKPEKITTRRGFNNAVFSRNYQYFINYYSNANTPLQVGLYNAKGKLIRTLEDNAGLKDKIKEYAFVNKELIDIETRSGIRLNAYMLKPADMESGRKYPLFMFVYGGPGSQQVTDSWDGGMAWKQMLVQQGYVVACVDNRGTGFRGEEFRKCTYMQLGKLETQDQIEAAMYFGELPFIDKGRIGIFGWSYGGYMSSLCLTLGADVFKLGIAVAPVTNWRFYDTIYTERYMRTPQENPAGYDDNSPINYADKLKGKFLLIHGAADDNVHYQNTMVFTEKLVQADRQFEMQIYPDKNHGIYGGNTSMHLYTRMTNFILSNL